MKKSPKVAKVIVLDQTIYFLYLRSQSYCSILGQLLANWSQIWGGYGIEKIPDPVQLSL